MVTYSAHDRKIKVRIFYPLVLTNSVFFNPSAGIGRQCKLKFCWFITVNVRVVPWICGGGIV